jgi:hypothetical protein
MKPLKTASAMRKALEGKAPGWIPTTFGAPGPKIGPAGDPVDDWDDGDGGDPPPAHDPGDTIDEPGGDE